MSLPDDPAFALETAACLWEAVLTLRDHPATNPDAIDLALRIGASFEAIGTSAMRLIVIGWSDVVDAAWSEVAADYPLSFDWDFVPDWIARHIDWSVAGAPEIRPGFGRPVRA
ncbi:hypothetical protein [Sphingopyxis sp. GC21]|uniref:hypothetical protein n=1 Tax=Sphingopyxis sp. GC21 TaxID=2933562 RepID=UPI0021E4BD9B|nr:hypothetical protein [Sphingopyxis sp. GC21]